MNPEQEAALRADGDRYFAVNHEGIGTIADPIFEQMQILHQLSPVKTVLEVGASNGFRLEKARSAFAAECAGLEASRDAVAEGHELFPYISLTEGMAPQDLVQFAGRKFDVIILGHFMYLLPRSELFALAAQVDALLMDNGHLIISDFFYPAPVSATYSHNPALDVFKMDPSAPWLWSPTYSLVHRNVYPISAYLTASAHPADWQTVDVLRKIPVATAYPPAQPQHDHLEGSALSS